MAEDDEIKPNPSFAVTNVTSGPTCPIRMGFLDWVHPRCKRPLHEAPPGVDKVTVCLMHSKDPRKNSGQLLDSFCHNIEEILDTAQDGEAVFTRFIFPGLAWDNRTIKARIVFNNCTFTKDASFSRTTYMRGTSFAGVVFSQDASFFGAKFMRNASFDNADFYHGASFSSAKFTKSSFFDAAVFTGETDFVGATFEANAVFIESKFKQSAKFRGTTFAQNALFERSQFNDEADFSFSKFIQDANFKEASFNKNVSFIGATFTQTGDFGGVQLEASADWSGSHFCAEAVFRGIALNTGLPNVPSAVFNMTSFSVPDRVVFDDIDLSRTLFNKCDVSEVRFTPSVRWGKRDNRKATLFEETIHLHQEHATGLVRNGERDYRAIAQIYQQLKKNYDDRLDYWTANEFHFGEMEMQRMAAPTEGPLLPLRRWWHRKLSLVAWYKYASDYGNSFTKPLYWLGGTLLLFAFLFPLPGLGLQQTGKTYTETYTAAWRAAHGPGQRLWWELALFLKGLLTAVDTAVFQKSPMYTMANPLGHAFTIAEMLLTSTLFALFLLAIRRQFRR